LTSTTDATAGPASSGSIIRRRARAHTHLVHTLRWLTPLAILALLGVLGAYVVGEAVRSAKGGIKDVPTEIRMINPHFVGRDDHGRSFNISAREAAREDADMQRVDLSYPVMIMDIDGPHPKTMTSDRGVYDERTRLLKLSGHVRADDAAASTLATDQATIDTKAGTISGASSIAAASPTGAIQAGSYTANEKTGHVILHGGVHGQLKGR
jgi:lipopolysaccharide export system protein LptC